MLVLIIDHRGSEKSSLANNYLIEDNFKQRLKIQEKIDTNLTNKEILYSIAETIGIMKEGISHLLFVMQNRFGPEKRKKLKQPCLKVILALLLPLLNVF
ncbi:7277_t:CDS:2 [Gigaspora margarita]|uniref:7277_t:CDS:1 n=1 Tax=Gigaspora margarita TaxID=4874 RepID=A0ABM8W443_GIGMA|nr:7277_t:CDS:2 [Gigaspora margarita]